MLISYKMFVHSLVRCIVKHFSRRRDGFHIFDTLHNSFRYYLMTLNNRYEKDLPILFELLQLQSTHFKNIYKSTCKIYYMIINQSSSEF